MKVKQLKRIANSEIAKLRKIKECKEHDWEGPVKKVEWADGHIFYEVACKHCPLGKMFADEAEAREAIK